MTTTVGQIVDVLADLSPDEREIVGTVALRIRDGRKTYGEWKVRTDPRNHLQEALVEVYDALAYSAGELIRLRALSEEKHDAEEGRDRPPPEVAAERGQEAVEEAGAGPEDEGPRARDSRGRKARRREEAAARTCADCGVALPEGSSKRRLRCDECRKQKLAFARKKAAAKNTDRREQIKSAAKKRAPALIRDNSAVGKPAKPDPVIEGMRANLAKKVRHVSPEEYEQKEKAAKKSQKGRPDPRPAGEVIAPRRGGTVML